MTGERGMTLVEVLVAATVLLVGVASTFAVVSRGQRLNTDAQRNSQAVAIAQAEVERVRSIPFAAIGMTASVTPTSSTCTTAPVLPTDWLRTGTPVALQIPTSYDSCPATANPGESLVVCGGTGAPSCTTATVAPGPTAVTLTDGTKAKIHRFVSWRSSTTCTSASGGCTTDPQASKRITVAVTLDAIPGGGIQRPIWTSTIVTPGATT